MLSIYLQIYINSPKQPSISTILTKKQSRPRDSIESPSREYLAFIFRRLNIQFRPPGVQDDIQDKVEHNPYHDVYAQDIRDVDIPYQRHVDQDKHQREQTDAYHHLSHFQPTSQQLVVDMVLVGQERILLVSQPVAHHSHHVEQRHQHGGKRQHHVIVAHGTGMHIHRTQVNHQETDDISQRQRTRIAHEELPAPSSRFQTHYNTRTA